MNTTKEKRVAYVKEFHKKYGLFPLPFEVSE